jgi:asparagine synthase (glutamine-hydrolysing)
MCGIAGVLELDGAPASLPLVRAMTATLAHRGPDGEGWHVQGPVGLGHRRLAIIDLSPTGRQPMNSVDGSIWLTFNGELYNFRELRAELKAHGHVFRSASDTEVVIEAYRRWGVDCLGRFNGMFAFGLWDAGRQRLWLVRDRLGVKPLFYARLATRLVFGSEIKALLADVGVDRSVDFEALSYYLTLNHTPAPHTLFARVRQVLPGHFLLVDVTGRVQDVEYWDVPYKSATESREAVWVEEFAALLEDAVRLRLVADVPYGAFLSGGIDSSAVASLMARHMAGPLKTFSIGFQEATFDERVYARAVARMLSAEHHEHVMSTDLATLLPTLVWHAEEPTADSSMAAVYHLARLARKHVTMVLSGDGADEILAGYETYQAYYLRRWYRRLPAWWRRHVVSPLVCALPASDGKVSWEFKLKRFVRGAELPSEDAHASWRMIFDGEQRRRLLAPLGDEPGLKADAVDLYRAMFAQASGRHPLDRMLYVDTRLYLPNDILVKVDRMTMARGLEAREPYLDYRLVEFAAYLPARYKLRGFRHRKYILTAAMRRRLPEAVLRRRKAGFNLPKARWMRAGLRDFVQDTLSTSRVVEIGWLDPRVVNEILVAHFDGRVDHSHQIWCLLVLALWHQQFVKRAA